jgi:hypothetical protein
MQIEDEGKIVQKARWEVDTTPFILILSAVCTGFFFFFLGPLCISSGSTAAFKAYCA